MAVAIAIVGASFVVYFTDRSELVGQLDSELSQTRTLPGLIGTIPAPAGRVSGVATRLTGSGAGIEVWSRQIVLPRSFKAVDVTVQALRSGLRNGLPVPRVARFTTVAAADGNTRVLTYVAKGKVVRITTPMLEVDHDLAHLRWLLVFISIGGIGVATILGALVSRTAVAPLRQLTETTERIIDTGDLSERIGHHGRDEISRLSGMVGRAPDHTRKLAPQPAAIGRGCLPRTADTDCDPACQLRASGRPGALGVGERAALADDVRDELEAITALVGELVELARGEELDIAPSDFRLDQVVQSAVDRAARRAPELSFRDMARAVGCLVLARERVERAVANLLDNARKWSPARETVDVAEAFETAWSRCATTGRDRSRRSPSLFNRFYRSATARAMPGAGLGLAIVKQIADAHGGSVTIDRAPDGVRSCGCSSRRSPERAAGANGARRLACDRRTQNAILPG